MVLLRGDEVGLRGQVDPVVDQDVGLQLTHLLGELDRVPVVAALAADALQGEVEPHDVDLAVVGQQFAGLAVEVFAVLGDVAGAVGLLEGVEQSGAVGEVADEVPDRRQDAARLFGGGMALDVVEQGFDELGMDPVDGEVRVMPVDDGVVEANLQPFFAEGFDPRPDEVAAAGVLVAL